MNYVKAGRRHGFSLLELVIVVVILGIIAAIAIPRMSRGSQGAADSALSGNLAVLRNAVELFSAEHNGSLPDGNIVTQLTEYTDSGGAVSATKTGNYIYGPYLRQVPPLPVGTRKGATGVGAVASGSPPTVDANCGWWYNTTTGDVYANLADTEVDALSKAYNTY